MVDIRRLHGKYPPLYNTIFALENIKYKLIEEDSEKGDAHKLPLKGRLAEGDKKVTLEVYLQERQISIEVIREP